MTDKIKAKKKHVHMGEESLEPVIYAQMLIYLGIIPSTYDFYGERIRLLILKANCTQSEFAKKYELTNTVVRERLWGAVTGNSKRKKSNFKVLKALHAACKDVGQGFEIAWVQHGVGMPINQISTEKRIEWTCEATGKINKTIKEMDLSEACSELGCSKSWVSEGRATPPDDIVNMAARFESKGMPLPPSETNFVLDELKDIELLERVLSDIITNGSNLRKLDGERLQNIHTRLQKLTLSRFSISSLEYTLADWRERYCEQVCKTIGKYLPAIPPPIFPK